MPARKATVPALPPKPAVAAAVESWQDVSVVDAAGAFAIEIMERCLNGTIDIRNGSEAAKLMEAMRGFIADVRGPAAHGGIIEARLIDPTAAFNNLMSLAASEARVPKEQER